MAYAMSSILAAPKQPIELQRISLVYKTSMPEIPKPRPRWNRGIKERTGDETNIQNEAIDVLIVGTSCYVRSLGTGG